MVRTRAKSLNIRVLCEKCGMELGSEWYPEETFMVEMRVPLCKKCVKKATPKVPKEEKERLEASLKKLQAAVSSAKKKAVKPKEKKSAVSPKRKKKGS